MPGQTRQNRRLFSADFDQYHANGEQLIPDDLLFEIWESVSKPVKAEKDFGRAIRVWIGICSQGLLDEIAADWPSHEREKLTALYLSSVEIIKASDQFRDALTAILEGNDAGPSMRLGRHLGTLDHKELRKSAALVQQMRQRLTPIVDATKGAIDVVGAEVSKADPRRTRQKKIKMEALGGLAVLWHWAQGNRKFGKKFHTFASLSLVGLLGEQEAEANLEEDVKIIRSRFNKDSDAYRLAFLD